MLELPHASEKWTQFFFAALAFYPEIIKFFCFFARYTSHLLSGADVTTLNKKLMSFNVKAFTYSLRQKVIKSIEPTKPTH